MITTRRSETNSINAFGSENSRGGVALLEKKEPVTYKEYVAPESTNESAEEARTRMQENLAKLLNYDRYAEQVKDVSPVLETEEVAPVSQDMVATTQTVQENTQSDEDIRPTSTTMQFGEEDIASLRLEMKKEAEEATGKYRLNAKGKLVVVLYALVLTVVMALIAINTGVLARLSVAEQSITAEYNSKVQALSQIQTEIESASNSDYIIEQAIEYGMIK